MLFQLLGLVSFGAFIFGVYKGATFIYEFRNRMHLYNYEAPPKSFPTHFPHREISSHLFNFESFYKIDEKVMSSDEEFIPQYLEMVDSSFRDNDHLPLVIIFDPEKTFGIKKMGEIKSIVKYYFFVNDKKIFCSKFLRECIVAYWAVKKTSRGEILYSDEFWISVDDCNEKEKQMSKSSHMVFRHAYNGHYLNLYHIVDRLGD